MAKNVRIQGGGDPEEALKSSEARNRKPLLRPVSFEANWELRFGPDNRFRAFYSVDLDRREVQILAIGVKRKDRLTIGGEEIEL